MVLIKIPLWFKIGWCKQIYKESTFFSLHVCFLLLYILGQCASQNTHVALAFEVPGGWHKEKDAITLIVLQVVVLALLEVLGRGCILGIQIQSFSAFNSIYNHTGIFGIHATMVLIGHTDNAEFALEMCPTVPLVISGALGSGCVKPNMLSHGGDQSRGDDPKQSRKPSS